VKYFSVFFLYSLPYEVFLSLSLRGLSEVIGEEAFPAHVQCRLWQSQLKSLEKVFCPSTGCCQHICGQSLFTKCVEADWACWWTWRVSTHASLFTNSYGAWHKQYWKRLTI